MNAMPLVLVVKIARIELWNEEGKYRYRFLGRRMVEDGVCLLALTLNIKTLTEA